MYQALYRKYRPQTFDDVVGQKSVTDTLKAQLQSDRLSHAYLFTGTRGTGKTSCAKILAKAVNCEHPVNGNPCNCCAACRNIASGACMDVQEIDAASNSGVDNVRTLRDDAIYTPAEVKKRVYIIDEVHNLSPAAFNALLKTMEEPPEHLLFILATTDKVPATILSRCQRFSFRRLLPEDIASRINYVAQQEGISIEPEAARLLARLADGALRDGMSLLDQCAASAQGTITPQSVYQCLGLAGIRTTARIMQAIAERNSRTALDLFFEAYAAGKDLPAMLDELMSLARDLLIFKVTSGKGGNFNTTDEEAVRSLSGQFTSEELIQIVSILQQTAFNLSKSANQRIDAELCLIQLCTPSLSTDANALNARLSRLETVISSGVVLNPSPAVQPREEPQTEPPEAEEPPVQQKPQQDDSWPEVARYLRAEIKPPFNGCFIDGTLAGRVQDNQYIFETEHSFTRDLVERQMDQITEKIKAFFGRELLVKVMLIGPTPKEHAGKMDDLISFGKQHSDIITIHQSS